MRTGGRALVETTFSLDIRPLVRAGAIGDDVHADGKMKFGPPDDDDAPPTVTPVKVDGAADATAPHELGRRRLGCCLGQSGNHAPQAYPSGHARGPEMKVASDSNL